MVYVIINYKILNTKHFIRKNYYGIYSTIKSLNRLFDFSNKITTPLMSMIDGHSEF